MRQRKLQITLIFSLAALASVLFLRLLVAVAVQESNEGLKAPVLLTQTNQAGYNNLSSTNSASDTFLESFPTNWLQAHNQVVEIPTHQDQSDELQDNEAGLSTLAVESTTAISTQNPETRNLFIQLEEKIEINAVQNRHFGFLQTPQTLSATCIVTSTNDSGAGSLRGCLAISLAGDSITFDTSVFPTTMPSTIDLASPLPSISVDNLMIDASDAGVILDGNNLPSGNGLVIDGANGVEIRGLQIVNFPWHGILIFNAATNNIIGGNPDVGDGLLGQGNLINGMSNSGRAGVVMASTGTMSNTISGNLIGTNISGTQPISNYFGIAIAAGASNNLIGGTEMGAKNLISGNSEAGIVIQDEGTTNNQIIGNFVGTDINGSDSISNTVFGIWIHSSASENLVGGADTGEGNLVSGNGNAGIQLQSLGTDSNSILGNFIGTNISGTQALPNGTDGVVIALGAANNSIGSDTPGSGNIISGNQRNGILILGGSSNQITGNYIGTNVDGNSRLSNEVDGIIISSNSENNTEAINNIIGGESIGAGNVISGNDDDGVQIEGDETTGNQILGNLIGTDSTGTEPLGNLEWGIAIQSGANNNIVGGTAAHAGNIISANGKDGITLQNESTIGNQIQGNFVGTNFNGTSSLGNFLWGISIGFGASENIIGGEIEGARNIISGNERAGITIQGSETTGNSVLGNFIGTDVTGLSAIPNADGVGISNEAKNNIIGGSVPGARNIISGNSDNGIQIEDIGTTNNFIIGNLIGTNANGTGSIANDDGVVIIEGASANNIGGSSDGERNVLSGNLRSGISVEGVGTTENRIIGNYIGIDINGTTAISNTQYGVFIGFGASENIIGGTLGGERNVISGNGTLGIWLQNIGTDFNEVLGNYVGTDPSGTVALPNERDGIGIGFGASNNIIGGESAGSQNLISGNGRNGIYIQDEETIGNRVIGNLVGTDINGTSAVPNENDGITISRARENVIGGTTATERNIISGNGEDGIQLQHSTAISNVVIGNYVGTNINGNQAIPNLQDGIVLWEEANNNVVGGLETGHRNLISGNSNLGVSIGGIGTMNNRLIGNYIGTNISGTNAIPNLFGVVIGFGATENIIGGLETGAANLISGNSASGIVLHKEGTENNHIIGNLVGSDVPNNNPLPNDEHGIYIYDSANNNTIGISNSITYNGGAGVYIECNDCVGNTITRNIMHSNTGLPIEFDTFVTTPIRITHFISETNIIEGITCANCRVEIFSSTSISPAANIYLGESAASEDGAFMFKLPRPLPSRFVSLNTTDENGTTSKFISTDLYTSYIYLPIVVWEQ